jgi:hypothetical protein
LAEEGEKKSNAPSWISNRLSDSAALNPYYKISPYDGILAAVGKDTKVDYHIGGYSHKMLPITFFDGCLKNPSGKPGVRVDFYNSDPDVDSSAKPVHTIESPETMLVFRESIPSHVGCLRA